MTERVSHYSIGVVERDTGIGRDTLRIWERRYGFPSPQRNAQGERLYDEAQLRRLQRIRRLLDQGLRPGKLLILDDAGLDRLEAELGDARLKPDEQLVELLEAVRTVDGEQLVGLLEARCREQGLIHFVLQTVAPLLQQVGEEWALGRLQIYQEHFLSAVIRTFLNAQIMSLPREANRPPVLLMTLPGEQHSLGLLMAQVLLVSGGINAINLGGEMPMDQVVRAAERFSARAVGLSFSAAYPYRHIRQDIEQLREQLPTSVGIWIGGEGVQRLRKLPPGVSKIHRLEELAGRSPKIAAEQ
jgi:DNA-binding transcriptional MerR regulator/methylmalonyl-CoA mutase cobalamin-binding subunit